MRAPSATFRACQHRPLSHLHAVSRSRWQGWWAGSCPTVAREVSRSGGRAWVARRGNTSARFLLVRLPISLPITGADALTFRRSLAQSAYTAPE